jgi:hypothetical protein
MFLAFLLLFSYVILCDFYPIEQINEDGHRIGQPINLSEIVLIFWVLMFGIDEVHEFFTIEKRQKFKRFLEYFGQFWNWVQWGSVILFGAGIALRFQTGMGYYLAARILLSLDIIIWFFRSLHGYAFIRSLGPKLVMIRRMISELAYFMLIIIVFVFAYGISTQSLMYHNQAFDLDLMKSIFFGAYFVIGGEYFERDKLMDGMATILFVCSLLSLFISY